MNTINKRAPGRREKVYYNKGRQLDLSAFEEAKKILEEFNNSNTGLVVIDGKLIEKPVLREMKRKILIADKINKG